MSVYEDTISYDNRGVQVTTTEVIFPEIRCRLRPLTAIEKVEYGQLGTNCSYKLYCEPLSITEDMYVKINNLKYDINGILTRQGAVGSEHFTLLLERVFHGNN
jgi:hypothetical protein